MRPAPPCGGLARTIFDVFDGLRLRVVDDEAGGAAEARVDVVLKRGAFGGNGDLHGGMLLEQLAGFATARVRAARDDERNVVDETQGHLLPRRGENAAESVARDAHARACLGLGEPFKVGRTQRLKLLELEADALG